MSFLTDLVIRKIDALGNVADAADFFAVPELTIRQWRSGGKSVALAAVEKVFDVPVIKSLTQNETANWVAKDTAILLPWYRAAHPCTAFSLLGLFDRRLMTIMLNFGDAFIAHSRNRLAQQYLETEFEWSLWVDSDMVLPWGNAQWYNDVTGFNLPEKFAGMHTINRLRSHKQTIVGGLYFGRHRGGKPMYCEGCTIQSEEAFARSGPYDTVKPARWVATGCLLVHRSVYLDIQSKFPELAPQNAKEPWNFFTSSEHDLVQAVVAAIACLENSRGSAEAKSVEVAAMLERARKKSRANSYLGGGEDVQFCVRAAQSGHQPFVDMGLLCGHVGDHIFGPRSV